MNNSDKMKQYGWYDVSDFRNISAFLEAYDILAFFLKSKSNEINPCRSCACEVLFCVKKGSQKTKNEKDIFKNDIKCRILA